MPERFFGRSLGKFRVDALIGTGGFAWVYKAFDPELEIPIALKVLKPQFAGDEQFEQRFRREAATAARLRHPNIIKIFAVGKDAEAVYFAMDFLPQGLPDRLEVVPTLPDSILIRMGIDVASALGFAHREGVIHRDIKVDNILFDEHGNAIVADFGIARAVSNYAQETGTNMVVGTPQYFSPEQARGLPLDGRSDIYSLGVTLYRAATGILPFTGDDWYEIARQHVEDRPVRARKHNAELGRDLESVIMRCLEKDPAARYQTGEALCQALGALSFERSETIAMRGTPAPIGGSTPSNAVAAKSARHWLDRRMRRLFGHRTGRALAAGGPAARSRRWVTAAGAAMVLALVVIGAQAMRRGRQSTAQAGGAVTGAIATTTGIAPPAPPLPSATVSSPGNGNPAAAARSVSGKSKRSHARGDSGTMAPGSGQSPPGSTQSTTNTAATTETADRGFGTVRLDAKPAGAAYMLQALDDGHITKGRTPVTGQLTLPAGVYAVLISARYCASYRDTLRIVAGRAAAPIHIRLVCVN